MQRALEGIRETGIGTLNVINKCINYNFSSKIEQYSPDKFTQ